MSEWPPQPPPRASSPASGRGLADWVRTHPYTTATPFIMAAVAVVFHVLTGAAWWKCALWVAAIMGIAAFNVWRKR